MREEQKEDLLALEALYLKLPAAVQAEIRLRRAAYEWILGNNEATYSNVSAAIEIAQSAGAKEIEARALLLAGRAALDLFQSEDYLKQALQVAQETHSPALEGDIIRCLGNAAYWQNKYHQSFNLFQQALRIHREVGDLRGELSALNNLGKVTELIGDLSEAVGYYTQAAEICRRIRDRLAEGVILTNLGQVTSNLGHFTEAKSQFEKAIHIRREIGNDEGRALAHEFLGNLYRMTGQYDLARAQYDEAYSIDVRIEHKEQTFSTLTAFATLYRELGDYDRAQDALEQAADYLPEPDSHLNLHYLINTSLLKTLTGDPGGALALGKEALTLSEELPWFQAPASKNLGHALLALGELEKAEDYYQRATAAYRDYQQDHLAPEPLAGLARIALLRGKPREALAAMQTCLPALESGTLQGPDRLLWVYLVCHQALAANDNPLASGIIQTAHRILTQRAESILDVKVRQAYLTGVRENFEINTIWESLSKRN
jgi:tetratricopeptide (TPR) repeat protein